MLTGHPPLRDQSDLRRRFGSNSDAKWSAYEVIAGAVTETDDAGVDDVLLLLLVAARSGELVMSSPTLNSKQHIMADEFLVVICSMAPFVESQLGLTQTPVGLGRLAMSAFGRMFPVIRSGHS